MTNNQAKAFIAAAQDAEITAYEFDSDLGTHLYHNENAFIKHDEANEIIYCFRSAQTGGSHNVYKGIQVVASWVEDLHEARIGGSYEQIKKFAESLGLSLSEDEIKILLHIDKANYDIKPATGDYVNAFHYLTKKQEALSDEEKAKYDSEKEKYEKAQHDYIGQNMAASIKF